jgi:hypothetical protein
MVGLEHVNSYADFESSGPDPLNRRFFSAFPAPACFDLALPSDRQSLRNCDTRRSLDVTACRDISGFIGMLLQVRDIVEVTAAAAEFLERNQSLARHHPEIPSLPFHCTACAPHLGKGGGDNQEIQH